jgi:hypothetical protein
VSSAPQSLAFFGRACSVSVTPQGGGTQTTIATTPGMPGIRMVFSAEKKMSVVVWLAHVAIYNLNSSTAATVTSGSGLSAFQNQQTNAQDPLLFTQAISMGDLVTISGGYQPASGTFNPANNLLYTGNVLQSIQTREHVVDTKVILRCVDQLALKSFAFSNFSRAKQQSDYDIVQQIAQSVGLKIAAIDAESQQILQSQPKSYSRGQAIFNRPLKVIDTICKQHVLFPWVDQNGLNIRSFGRSTTGSLTPTYTYSPPNLQSNTTATSSTGTIKSTLIGTPEQTQLGVTFRVLMDSQVNLGDTVAIAQGTAINGFQFPYGSLPPLPNAAGTYIVLGLRHVGDTRGTGDDWYTEIIAVTPAYFSTLVSAMTAGGGN